VINRSDPLILCYHRVAEEVVDPFGMTVTPANFAAQLEELARACEPSVLDDLDRPSRKRRAVVTFDDGYADNLWHALPVAQRKGFPITVFVTSGKIGDTRGMWWDRLGAVLGARPAAITSVDLPSPGGGVTVSLGNGERVDLQAVRARLLELTVPEIDRALDDVAERWAVAAAGPAEARTMTPDELSELAAADVVTIGAHTFDHLRLRGRSAEEQTAAVATSKADLETVTGAPVDHFAYPYGGYDAYDEGAVQAVRAAGFVTACTTVPGSAGASEDRFLLPRRIAADWGRLRFRAQLARWSLW
jgi:peptidoglycan/xylan/chitin deacetylase (PgdA/CDA1 family)